MGASKKEIYLNKDYTLLDGSHIKIVEYDTCKNITIEFDYGYKIKTTVNILNKGYFKHPNLRTVYNIGYIGVGGYNVADDKVMYDKWSGMLRRCCDEKYKEKHPTYKNCKVVEEWECFQNFANWYSKKHRKGYELDKDILIKGNKIYSPETCCFVPSRINSLFIKRDNDRGEYPLGVSYNKRDNLYAISLPKDKKGKLNFKTCEEAFNNFKILKEEYIKEVADEWKENIDLEVHEAMYRWIIEITD